MAKQPKAPFLSAMAQYYQCLKSAAKVAVVPLSKGPRKDCRHDIQSLANVASVDEAGAIYERAGKSSDEP